MFLLLAAANLQSF
uniref:Uncharacterized protein n=1 Tax=Arundo donax TaxID=35708 RepID=A0A0A9G1N7_ARUDO